MFFVLTSIIWITRIINYLEYITEYGLGVKNFIIIILLLLPGLLTITASLSLFLSVIFAYDRLIKNNEMVILQNAGVGKFQLVKPTIYLSAIVVALLFFNTMFLIPKTNKQFSHMKEIMKNDIINLMFKNNNFDSIKNVTFYAVTNEQQGLENLVIYSRSENGEGKHKIIYSKTAEINGVLLRLMDGNIQEFNPNIADENNSIFFKEYNLNLGDYYNLNPKKNNSMDMSAMNVVELLKIKENQEIDGEIIKRGANSVVGLFLSVLGCCLILDKKFSRMRDDTEIVKIYLICALLFAIFIYLAKNSGASTPLLAYIFTLYLLDLILIKKRNVL
jgi:lipopolysaccharide export system permease protein